MIDVEIHFLLGSERFPSFLFQIIRTSNIIDDYEMGEEIAKGAYASCRRAIHRISKTEHAVKVNRKRFGFQFIFGIPFKALLGFQIITKGKKEWHDEVDILLRHSQHPHIVTLYTVRDPWRIETCVLTPNCFFDRFTRILQIFTL
jgi:hypothetical protein